MSCCAVAVLAAAACSSKKSSSTDDADAAATCPPDNPQCAEAATVDTGSKLVDEKGCKNCHTPNMSGSPNPLSKDSKGNPVPDTVKLYPPNLTSDKDTGVGDWTDDQLARGIRNGIDNQNEQLCPQMQHFADFTDFEVYSVVKYLRSIPTVNNKVPGSICPPLKN
jgi:mono/diheme cytochrome c family protein